MKTLFLMCGLPGAGKTTLARQMEGATAALRLSPDEWIAQLLADPSDRAELARLRAPVEALQWEVAARALELGQDVILEWGFRSRAERDATRAKAEALGARVEVCFLHAGRGELWARLLRRNADRPAGTFVVSEEELDLWWAELESPSAEELGGVPGGATGNGAPGQPLRGTG